MDKMQQFLKKLNPVAQSDKPKLIYGAKYNCFLEGKPIGIFTWTQDENVGDSFQNQKPDGVIEVALPDSWERLN